MVSGVVSKKDKTIDSSPKLQAAEAKQVASPHADRSTSAASCGPASNFSRERILECTRRFYGGEAVSEYDSKYLCSTCNRVRCPLELNFRQQGCVSTLREDSRLRDVSVAFVGDSIMAQLFAVAKCALDADESWTFHNLVVVPHREALATLLREVLAASRETQGWTLFRRRLLADWSCAGWPP